ncbi:MAG: polymorphic toxin type 15 domain-containing protein, partial [Blautia wexlerae]
LGAGSILAGAFIGAGIGALSTTAMKAGEEISTGNVRSAKEAFRDVGISAASGFITGAFGAKFPGAHRLVEGVVDTAVSAGERLAYAVFDDSMSWDEKWAYAFDPGQMVADFVTGVVIGEILDGIMAATQNKLRSIFANYDATMREALESGEDVLDEIKRIDEIEVEFNYNSKFDEAEFARQLADQQKGMNELTVREYLDNRQKYIEQGRAIESNAAQQAAREKAFVDKVDELQDAGLSLKEAEEQAEKWLDTQAALHNPDQVAGGYASNVGGVGDKGVNSSIGSQWRYRIDGVDAQIKKMAESMSEAEKNSTYLNVKLAHKGD